MEMAHCLSEILTHFQGVDCGYLGPLAPRLIMWHFQTCPIKGSNIILISLSFLVLLLDVHMQGD